MSWREETALKLRRFMYGRYGPDQYNRFINYLALLFIVIGFFTEGRTIQVLGLVLIIYAYFRMFSKERTARRRENEKYLQATLPIRSFIFRRKSQRKDKNFLYFACPACRKNLRVPKGVGTIHISCPHCGHEFDKRV